jgi:hypothetical protein
MDYPNRTISPVQGSGEGREVGKFIPGRSCPLKWTKPDHGITTTAISG